MFEIIKKSILAGIGAAVLTKEKIQEATRLFVEEGKISTEEAEKLADDLVRSGERQWDDLNARISEAMKKWADNLDMVRKSDYVALRARLEILEERVTTLEKVHLREKEADEKKSSPGGDYESRSGAGEYDRKSGAGTYERGSVVGEY